MAFAVEVVTGTGPQFGGREEANRLVHGAFPVHQFQFNRIEPGTLDWQSAGEDADPARLRKS